MSSIVNQNHAKLYELHELMQHCIVIKKVGQSTCYELYEEETNRFLLSCVSCVLISPMLLFVTSQDCHQRKFEDICCNLNIRYFVAKMTPDWMTGLNFKLTGFDESVLCEIKIKSPVLTSAPVSFSMKVPNPDYNADESPPSPPSRPSSARPTPSHSVSSQKSGSGWASGGGWGGWSCLDAACLEEGLVIAGCSGADDRTTSTSNNRTNKPESTNGTNRKPSSTALTTPATLYTSLSDNPPNPPFLDLHTKKPSWNVELRQWTDHYGGRVRVPSRHNFMVLVEDKGVVGERCRVAEPAVGGFLDDPNLTRMCIRHGKTGVNTFVLDFRAPATALTAFAAMCAVHA